MPDLPITLPGRVPGVALVDAEDFAWASKFKWHLSGRGRDGKRVYVCRKIPTGLARPRQKEVYLHREILARMGHPDAEQGDHINRDPRDNSRANLRPATLAINLENRDMTLLTGRPRTLPDAEPRACRRCGVVYTPARKKWRSIYCSAQCQRSSVMTYDSESQRKRSITRWSK